MVEDKIQDKESINQIPGEEISSKKKIGESFSDMFRLFKKSKPKGDKPVGGAGTTSGIQKTTTLKSAAFNVPKVNLKTINQVLAVVLVGLVVLMFYVSLREKPEISSVIAAISNIKLPEVESKVVVAFKELPHYLGQIKKRDIFSAFADKKAPVRVVVESVKAPEPPPIPVVPIEQKAKNIKLIGISWGQNPKAMIRNIDSQSVQFTSVGEKIDGTDLEVKKILKSEVILSSEGQEMSLM